MENICNWKIDVNDFDDDCYKTSCGNLFVLIEGTLQDNKMKYCPYCGKLIKTKGAKE